MLPSGGRCTRNEHARSQADHQSNRHHDERADERGFCGHQEDNAEQQGGYGQHRCQEHRVMDTMAQRLRQRAVWCLTCQPVDGAPARLDERCPEWGHQDQAYQPNSNPAGFEAPGGDRHVEPGGEDEQHADPEKRA